jgi:drug/metabolite transporter (DMT)-like permease
LHLPVGELASLAAAACWAVGLTLFRRDVRAIGARQVNFFKGLVGTSMMLLCLAFTGFGEIGAYEQWMLVLSGFVGLALGDSLLFVALGQLGPHKASLLLSLGPVLTAAGGWALGEVLSLQEVLGIACAVAGIGLVAYYRPVGGPEPEANARGVLFGVAAAACQATGVLLAKQGLPEGVAAFPATALRLAAATAALAVVAFAGRRLGPDLKQLIRPGPVRRLIPAAFIGTFLGLWLMQIGIKYTDSAVANALHSTTPLFTIPITVFVLKEKLGPAVVAGSVLGVGGVVLLLLS